MSKIKLFLKCVLLLTAIGTFQSCVVGQHIKMNYTPEGSAATANGKSVLLKVKDMRPYILDGDKNPSYIGHYRAGFGNTWDVTTENEFPLADKLEEDLSKELIHLGFAVKSSSKQVKVLIHEWNFDAYQNGRFWYELNIQVLQGSSQEAESTVSETIRIEGSFWTGAKAGFERDMPNIYKNIILSVFATIPKY